METETINSETSSVKYKLVLLGDLRVGKTSILAQFDHGAFNEHYTATVGIDFLAKTLPLDDRNVCLQLWDTAGLERFRSLVPMYIRGSSAAVICFDVTNRRTLEHADRWMEEVKRNIATDAIVVLVGNKVDNVQERCVTSEEGAAKAKELGAMYAEVSAKTGDNIYRFNKIEILCIECNNHILFKIYNWLIIKVLYYSRWIKYFIHTNR